MSEFDSMQEVLAASIEKLSDYLQIEKRPTFIIIDDDTDGPLIVQDTTDENYDYSKCFTVSNVQKIGFIPIDGKNGLNKFGVDRCECVFFDNANFCFVEFKLNATSLKDRAVAKNRRDAIKQLEATINFFDKKTNRNYANLILEAYICTPPEYPQNNARLKELAAIFLEKNGIGLFEQNYKICQ